MKRFIQLVAAIFFCGIMMAQDAGSQHEAASAGTEEAVPVVPVEMQFEDVSFFIETPATSVVRLPSPVEYPLIEFIDTGPFRLLDYSLRPATGNSPPSVEIRWYPVSEGLATFPVIQISTGNAAYRTSPKQVLIKAPVKSDDLGLAFLPSKSRVYAGEPLRLDVVWRSSVSTKRIRSLECYPSFFNDPGLEIAIPMSTDPESQQLGIPFGGRRVIARRDMDPENAQALGTVSFPMYIKFSVPGTVTLARARLECAQLHKEGGPLAPYAAYYNNGLFERVEKGTGYDKIFTESDAVVIEVLPLPEEGRTETFSGLFTPCSITTRIRPDEGSVGQLMDLDIIVNSPVCSDFLMLPSLDKQKGLRSWFKVDPDYTRTWLPDGANFNARIRALTTKAKAVPALGFQVFNPDRGKYEIIETPAIPIKIHPQDGKDYFDSKVLLDTTSNLATREEGIWHNRGATKMHDFLDTILGITGNHFWIIMAIGPVAFLIALPRALEYRRRELDPVYHAQIDAYRNFMKLPEGDVRKWMALKKLIAVSLEAEPGSWTIGDSREKLSHAGVDQEIIRQICTCHEVVDSGTYSTGKPQITLPPLKKAGQSLFKVLRKISVAAVYVLAMIPADTDAQDWGSAESLFNSAMQMEPGTAEYYSAFSRAALQYEAVASSGKHPGMAWYNAGNAWFFAGEIGRSIACYKHAVIHRPFDPLVKKNMAAARALAIDVVEKGDAPLWTSWPIRWIGLILIVTSFVFWSMLLAWSRYRSRPLLTLTCASLAVVALFGCLALYATVWRNQPGVVIVQEVFGRKGPGYNYLTAFHEPLHDGLEFEVIGSRNEWINIELTDGRNCWIPRSQAHLIDLSL